MQLSHLIRQILAPGQYEEEKPPVQSGTLYLRLPTQEGKLFEKVKAMLTMFPGQSSAVIYFEDTKKRCGGQCALDARLLQALTELLGKPNVVIK